MIASFGSGSLFDLLLGGLALIELSGLLIGSNGPERLFQELAGLLALTADVAFGLNGRLTGRRDSASTR